MTTIPVQHIDDAQQLVSDGYVELFQIDLYSGSSIYVKADHAETWQGNVYEGLGMKITGVARYGDEQVSRPQLQVQNPDGIFSPFVSEGVFEGSFVTRYRVLYADLLADLPIYVSEVWQISRIVGLTKSALQVELRTFSDSPVFIIPGDTFSPPKFPVVSVR